MLNFTVGPVMQYERTKKIAGEDSPYFRTKEFSEINLESEVLLKKLQYASPECKCVFLTGSGTFGMECAVSNILKSNDKVIVVNGGSFGQRFANLMNLYNIENTEIKLDFGKALKEDTLYQYANEGYTALCVNMHETSSGVLYDMELISKFCKENNLVLIVDAISAFISEELYMDKWGVDCVITASQKAFALQPGLSTLTLSPRALARVYQEEGRVTSSLYMDMRYALENQVRGQPPYTPCISIFLQMNDRLKMLSETKNGSLVLDLERQHINKLANEFRDFAKTTYFKNVSESNSNCVTCLYTEKNDAKHLIETLKTKYGIWICPNGGDKADNTFRVGHIGNITDENNEYLISSFKELLGI